MTLDGPCHVQDIGGGLIQIKKKGAVKLTRWFSTTKLTAQTIEGDDIYLEYTKASIVRGSQVTIGEGCDIGKVEYKMAFHQEKGAKVGQFEQV